MSVDYEQQLLDNDAEKKTAIENSNATYDQTISDYKDVVDDQQQMLEDYKTEQTRLQREQTDFAIDKINQQKEQAEKDYTKEQQAAYGDYKKQTDPYGANAEQMAALGLSRSGYSESSNVAMYTAYQNRVAAARASMEQAKLTFENAIREAKLTNDINLAKIAAETLGQSLALSMESIVKLGSLNLEKAANARVIEQTYYDRAQDIRAAQAAEIDKAQQGDDEGSDNGTWEELLKEEYPDGVIDDVDFWNQMAEAAGGEDVLKEMGYSLADQPTEPEAVTEPPKYTDEYTLLVEEHERLVDAYLSAKRTYEAVSKWGPSPEHKAAMEAAEKALNDSPVEKNPEYEQQKKNVEAARWEWEYATNKNYTRNQDEVNAATKKLREEEEKLQNMKPYIITRRNYTGGTATIEQVVGNHASLR